MAGTKTLFTEHVAGNVRAELARRKLATVDLIPVLGLTKNAVYARVNGDQPFIIDELDALATFLGVSVGYLVERHSDKAEKAA